ncbi:MAG: ATP-grasp domain-containing protein [Methanoregula sp.]|nr:ATP-grasp domain-containing protein [Methanoregula sp.]
MIDTIIKKNSEHYFWIIGGGLLQYPLIQEVDDLGCKVIVSDRNPECICAKKATIFLPIDIFDVQKHLEEGFKLKASGIKIDGVLAAGIDATVTMAVLARSLNLPGVDPEIAYITNNKNLFRETLQKLGYPVPKFRVISESDIGNIESIASEIGYPLIIKNTDSSGSRGTKIFLKEDPEDMRLIAKTAIVASRSKRALVEECWMGEEFTVETIFDNNGGFHPCFITDRFFDKSRGYAIELGLGHPTRLPPEIQQEMYDLVRNVSRDLGIKIGAAKADMILTPKGPRIIEMTVRLSGGFDCQYLVPATTGKNVMRAAILTALGKPFPESLLVDKKHRVGRTASIWPEPGKIVRISGVEEALKIPGVEHIFFRYNVGDTIEPYMDCTRRVCFIIVTGRDAPDAEKTMKIAIGKIQIDIKRER